MLKITFNHPQIITFHHMLKARYNELFTDQSQFDWEVDLTFHKLIMQELGKKISLAVFKGCNSKGKYDIKFTDSELYVILTQKFNAENNDFIHSVEIFLRTEAHQYFTNLNLQPIPEPNQSFQNLMLN